jgi:hypothetical protein
VYSIEHYKTKRDKPEIKEPNYTSNGRYHKRRRFLYQSDLIEKCWDIKSLTIDLDDIKQVIYDESCHHLLSLYARIEKINTLGTKSITILNNNVTNLLYIYEIINCDWMINENVGENEHKVEAKALRLGTHFKRVK